MNATGLETKCALVTDGKISGFAKGLSSVRSHPRQPKEDLWQWFRMGIG